MWIYVPFILSLFLAVFLFTQIAKVGARNKSYPELDQWLQYLYDGLGRWPFATYEMSPYVKLRLHDIWDDETVIQELAKDMLAHLGLPGDSVQVQVEQIPETQEQSTVANFDEGDTHNKIHIRIKRRYSQENIISILCHECSHHMLYTKGLEQLDPEKNEILTDVAAMYFGFGPFMIAGYTPVIAPTEYTDETGRVCRSKVWIKVGYMNVNQLAYIQRKIDAQMGWGD